MICQDTYIQIAEEIAFSTYFVKALHIHILIRMHFSSQNRKKKKRKPHLVLLQFSPIFPSLCLPPRWRHNQLFIMNLGSESGIRKWLISSWGLCQQPKHFTTVLRLFIFCFLLFSLLICSFVCFFFYFLSVATKIERRKEEEAYDMN